MELIERINSVTKKHIAFLKEKYGIDALCSIKVKPKVIQINVPNLSLIKATEDDFEDEEKNLQFKVSLIDETFKVKFVDK